MTTGNSVLLYVCVLDRFVFHHKQYHGRDKMNISGHWEALLITVPLQQRDGLGVLESFLVAKKSSLNVYKTNQRFVIAENISGVLLFYLFGPTYALEWYSYI